MEARLLIRLHAFFGSVRWPVLECDGKTRGAAPRFRCRLRRSVTASLASATVRVLRFYDPDRRDTSCSCLQVQVGPLHAGQCAAARGGQHRQLEKGDALTPREPSWFNPERIAARSTRSSPSAHPLSGHPVREWDRLGRREPDGTDIFRRWSDRSVLGRGP